MRKLGYRVECKESEIDMNKGPDASRRVGII
jgi:hypothetical protein